MASLANAYRQLEIPTAVMADFDLLKNETEFAAVYTALGGNFAHIEVLYRSTAKQLGDQSPVISTQDFIAEFRGLLGAIEAEQRVSSESKRKASELIENAADWSEAKKYGLDKLKGGARSDAKKLVERCQDCGLFLVEKGELESWWRDGPANKREWIAAAISKLSADPGVFVNAQDFVSRVCKYFGY
jgi:hypothetical protein